MTWNHATQVRPMKLALLGADAEALELIEFETRGGAHTLVAAFDFGEHAAAIRDIAPDVSLDEDWESLLLGSRVDLVIVGRGQPRWSDVTGIPDAERRGEQLRKLAQAAIPMLVFCPACEAIVGFEVEMIRRDVQGWIFPYVPRTPTLGALQILIAQGIESPIGSFEQLVMEREMEDRQRDVVLMSFTRDVSIFRQLLGHVSKITASGAPTPVGRDPLGPRSNRKLSLANLAVHVQGEREIVGRWLIGPVRGQPGARLTLVGSSGSAVLSMPERIDRYTLTIHGESYDTDVDDSEYPQLLDGLAAAMQEKPSDNESAWLDACRDQEAAEAVDRSLARGRTIELFGEEHTEEESFKGVMAMGGCLLLVTALAAVMLAVVVEGLRLPLRNWPLWKLWPVWLLAPIVAFLLLQLLQLAIKRETAGELNPRPSGTRFGPG